MTASKANRVNPPPSIKGNNDYQSPIKQRAINRSQRFIHTHSIKSQPTMTDLLLQFAAMGQIHQATTLATTSRGRGNTQRGRARGRGLPLYSTQQPQRGRGRGRGVVMHHPPPTSSSRGTYQRVMTTAAAKPPPPMRGGVIAGSMSPAVCSVSLRNFSNYFYTEA